MLPQHVADLALEPLREVFQRFERHPRETSAHPGCLGTLESADNRSLNSTSPPAIIPQSLNKGFPRKAETRK
jgi:hypothetical protein